MASISFEYSEDNLILCYTPAMGFSDIITRLYTEDGVSIKHTFWVTKDLLCEDIDEDEDREETLRFCIGTVGKAYTKIYSDVLVTEPLEMRLI